MRSALVVALLTGTACQAVGTTGLFDPPPHVDAEVRRGLEACDASTHWRSPVSLYGWWPRTPSFSPDGAVVSHAAAVYLGGLTYLGTGDGRTLAVSRHETFDLDEGWRRRLSFEGREVVVYEDLDRVFAVEDVRIAILTPAGSRVVGMTETGLAWWGLDSDETGSVALPGIVVQSIVRVDERHVIVLGLERIAVVDLEAGLLATRRIAQGSEDAIVGATSHAGRVAVTTLDGRLMVLRLDTLETIDTRRTSIVRINEDIYAPLVLASPVAWSRDAQLFAFLDETGDIVVEGVDGELHRIAPIEPEEGRRFGAEGPYLPGAFSFSEGSDRLAVAYEADFVMYACDDVERPAVTADLDVTMQAPATARVGEDVDITFDVPNHDGFRAARLEVDGVDAETGTERTALRWVGSKPGPHELRVFVDTGRAHGSAGHTIMLTN